MNHLYEYTDELNQPMEAFHHIPYPGNFPVLPHWHYFIEIIYLLEGHIETTCDGAVYAMHPGDLIIFCPQKLHSVDILHDKTLPSGLIPGKVSYQSRLFSEDASPRIDSAHNAIYPVPKEHSGLKDTNSGIRYEVLKFDLNFLNTSNRFKTHFSHTLVHAFEKAPEHIFFSSEMLKEIPVASIIKDCIEEMDILEYDSDTIAGSLTSVLLVHLMRIWRKRGVTPEAAMKQAPAFTHTFHEITQYIENHYNEALQVQELAAHCNMSYSYFAKLFRQTYNQSCKDYIEFVRINKVLDLLRFTNYDLTYISQETGFADCSHLIRTFKKRKGTTPKKWRDKHQYH